MQDAVPPDPNASAEPDADAVDSATSDAAHDFDMIREALARTPEERLRVLQDFVDTFWTPQHG